MKRSAVWKTVSRRGKGLGASLCALALAALAVWQGPQEAQAAYLDPYIERVTQLGLMRGDIDGNLMPESDISRAEFVTIVNRAFGYDEMGGIPFDDVPEEAWYAEDVDIGYTAGYITGTSESTFSPLEPVTREQAAVMLARNLVMQPAVGENVSFTDSRDLSAWSRGLVSTASQYNLISGYPDGSFHPQDAITRGEAAIMLLNAVGTPIQEPGVQSLGNVWGNVTITTSGVTLRDTVVGGNLYITAGVGLGDVILENVTVLGEIVVSGGGVSERGDDSVVLRNVNAPTLVVDNIRNQHVSLRVEGDGVIDNASIRTDAYLVDNTPSNAGVLRMELNGEEGLSLTLGGNIKEVINKTQESTLSLSSGQASVITVDEAATGSVLEIASGAEAGTVNLDTATQVTGDGDIGHLVVNAGGSTVSMLPDQITIRPGIDATIDGETMDSEAAAEASADPRLLAGYPRITDLAPTTATAQFSGNKRGTVYWAVTSVTDGSVGTGDLINPPSYTTNIVANGTVSLSGANEPATVQINRLTSDGSYYLSTVMVDARGDQSPLKVISFTTPDNSVPDFADGYPYLSRITNVSVQATVMATKTCRLYWAVLPDGASAPTAQDFRANAVTGNLGFGTLDVTKNTAYSFDANNVALEELEDYTLYLWLTDIGGGQSSRVESLDFTTVDRTPPRFNTDATVNEVERTSVGLYANLNEDGTLYWVVVPQGEVYPKPLAGQSGAVDLGSDTAKLQVSSGMNALKSGNVRMREGQDVEFRISGLDPETAYDLYYVAQDTAGNYSARVQMITIHTLDPNAPTVTQEFTEYPGENSTQPYPGTDIRLVFSEEVQDAETNITLVEYSDRVKDGSMSREDFATILRDCIELYQDTGNGRPSKVVDASDPENNPPVTDKNTQAWVIDYRYAEAVMEDGKTVVIFPTTDSKATSALNLASGATYYFEIPANTVADTSDARNTMGTTRLDEFTTVFAIVNLSNPNESEFGTGETVLDGTTAAEGDTVTFPDDDSRLIDVSWVLSPESTNSVPDNVDWDMIMWFNVSVAFDLYARELENGDGTWELIGKDVSVTVPSTSERVGVSLTTILRPGNNPQFDQLNTLDPQKDYEYAIHFNRVGTLEDRDTWSQRVLVGVTVLAGTTDGLQALALGSVTDEDLEEELAAGLMNIGMPDDFELRKQFSDQTAPVFTNSNPSFEAGDSMVNIRVSLDRPGIIYYVVAPIGTIPTTGYKLAADGVTPEGEEMFFSPNIPDGADETTIDQLKKDYRELPQYGVYGNLPFSYPFEINVPTVLQIVNADYTNTRIKSGSMRADTAESEQSVGDLEANQDYIAYFVIQGTSSQVYSEQVYAYRFTTSDVAKPVLTLQELSPNVAYETDQDSNVNMVLFAGTELPTIFRTPFINYVEDSLKETFRAAASTAADTMTVLQALQRTGTGGYSWFDIYAEVDEGGIRQTVADIVLRGQGSGGDPGATYSDETVANVEEQHNFTANMDPNSATRYDCIAIAKNILGGDYSFKAVANVHIPDTTPPELVSVSGGIGVLDPKTNTFSGRLYLTFSEAVYWIPESGNTDEICEAWNNSNYDTGDKEAEIVDGVVVPGHIAILAHMGGASMQLKPVVGTTGPSSTFEFTYSGVSVGDGLTLFRDGYIADVNGVSTRNKIELTYVYTNTGEQDFLTGGIWQKVE